ncbi:MAG: GatB/YqeY domain-containing protein [Chitinispirillales bacterium]|jgi:uncharacterized protein YqeY|nr:GatB/YqeY domain-containing protein [Chitinispirillales bacterium]
MSVAQQLQEDIKITMKSGEKEKLLVLRTLHSDIKNFEINGKRTASDEDIFTILAKGIKTRLESADQYKSAGREDLAMQEEFEIDIYKRYQPKQLSPDELKTIVDDAVAKSGASGAKEMGKVMAILMPIVKGKADGKLVNDLVKAALV